MNRQDILIHCPAYLNLDPVRRAAWDRFMDEAVVLIGGADLALLREWGRRSLSVAVQTTVGRAGALVRLIGAAARGAWDEFKAIFKSIVDGRFCEHMKDLCSRIWQKLLAFWEAVKAAASRAVDFVRGLQSASDAELIDYAASFLGGVLGFVLMGGMGDGGFIDMDIAVFGLGGHRSIFFHSILMGLAAEVCFRSLFELVSILHDRLPPDHSPIWDRLLRIERRFRNALISGSWVGVTTHLAIDSHIDGWTPYKDLPIALPEWGHHLVMDMNAAAGGWLGWQWHDKIKTVFRDNRIIAPSAGGALLPQLEAAS